MTVFEFLFTLYDFYKHSNKIPEGERLCRYSKYPTYSRYLWKVFSAVLWISIAFNADLDLGSHTNADPDPGQILLSKKLNF